MHIDLDLAESGRLFKARFCVVGGGIAGLIVAGRLAERGGDVLLLEAGGLELEERSQRLYEAEMGGTDYAGAVEGRFRTFGGSSTRWGGQLLPYTTDVFAEWPISEEEVAPFYGELERMLGVDALPFDAGLLAALKRPTVKFSGDVRLRFSKWIPFGKRNLARTLGKAALAHPKITVVSHANVAELVGDEGRISAALVLDYAGREFRCEAETFVVATGTIESSRLLLLSAAAVPDEHGQLGRYFHDHLSWRAAEFAAGAKAQFGGGPGRSEAEASGYLDARTVRSGAVEMGGRSEVVDARAGWGTADTSARLDVVDTRAGSGVRGKMLERLGPFFVDGTLHTCKLEASEELRVRENLLAVMAHVTIEEAEDSGASAARKLMEAVQRGKVREGVAENLLPMLRGVADVARLFFYARFKQRRAVSERARVWLHVDLEQAARGENCIRLSEEKDALGLRKAVVDWRVGEREWDTALRYAGMIREELERLGMGPELWTEMPVFVDTFHAMGGLRMGVDARESVVDRDLRVHGVRNLYVASCAVYPSGGSSNPTFTLMALALRLADHLIAR